MVYDANRLDELTTLKGRWALAGLAEQNPALLASLKESETSLIANDTALTTALAAEGESAPVYEFGSDTLPHLLASVQQMQAWRPP